MYERSFAKTRGNLITFIEIQSNGEDITVESLINAFVVLNEEIEKLADTVISKVSNPPYLGNRLFTHLSTLHDILRNNESIINGLGKNIKDEIEIKKNLIRELLPELKKLEEAIKQLEKEEKIHIERKNEKDRLQIEHDRIDAAIKRLNAPTVGEIDQLKKTIKEMEKDRIKLEVEGKELDKEKTKLMGKLNEVESIYNRSKEHNSNSKEPTGYKGSRVKEEKEMEKTTYYVTLRRTFKGGGERIVVVNAKTKLDANMAASYMLMKNEKFVKAETFEELSPKQKANLSEAIWA